MYFLTTWKTAMTYNHRFGFFYQDPTDFDPALQQQLPSLGAAVYKWVRCVCRAELRRLMSAVKSALLFIAWSL
jgi:hypothetical protein